MENEIQKIKEIALKAIYSDDHLMEIFVFKGGSAIDMFYPSMASRSSMDLDFSIEEDLDSENISKKIEKTLRKTFSEENYEIFDYSFKPKPKNVSEDVKDFWGGYKIIFKIIDKETFEKYKSNVDLLSKISIDIGLKNKKFQIDISKYEYCKNSVHTELDDLKVVVYTPEMIAFEKLRAICQQMPEYNIIVHRNRQNAKSNRARDFFDFYYIIELGEIDVSLPENLEIIRNIFDAKKVPLKYISKIKDNKEFYETGFQTVRETVNPNFEIKEFDFYFEYLVEECEKLKSLWIV